MKYYIDISASVLGDGSKDKPFKYIQNAADIACAGDEVIVAPGIYREAVSPHNSGEESARIVYRSEIPGKAVITGAMELRDWKKQDQNIWMSQIDNRIFGEYNPYKVRVEGDWFIKDDNKPAHTGDVYLNHKSMYEVFSLEDVISPVKSKQSWDPDFSLYCWYTVQDEKSDSTIIYANFGEFDPNKEKVEISVRKNCFMPKEYGRNYITLSGFTIRQAATQWAPPTAFQDGMIGPNWSKGWIIENCEIYESKCSGISLGKYLQEGNDNKWLKEKYKDGTQTQRECVILASYEGWDKEHIGSHVIRNCEIHDCGQTGIVGHLGGVFSVIEDNHIYNINNKQNLTGAEIGGIKMHAAIDVIYRHNHIHHCTRGIWLDWQAQGTRVTQNLLYDNTMPLNLDDYMDEDFGVYGGMIGEDLFIEVSHGPTLVDNNIMLSQRAVKFPTQGVAMVHNLIAGAFTCVGTGTDNGAVDLPSQRYTPYHLPHSTQIVGFMSFLHGDNRFYNNVFVQQAIHPLFLKVQEGVRKGDIDDMWDTFLFETGSHAFDAYPDFDEWKDMFEGYCGIGSSASNRYYTKLPIWSAGNVYLSGARAWKKEKNPVIIEDCDFEWGITNKDDGYEFVSNLVEILSRCGCSSELISTTTLGKAFEPEEFFENPDGSEIVFNEDYYGNRRLDRIVPGPIV